MMGFLSGFSSWLLNTDSFNPLSGIPCLTFSCHNIKLPIILEYMDAPKIYMDAPKICFRGRECGKSGIRHNPYSGGEGTTTCMPSQRVGHARIRVQEQQQANESAIFDDWFGTAQIDGEELPFTTNYDGLEADNEYHIVYERTEVPTGEAGIRVHDVIS
jgi:hypothetical protein